ncbi:MAG: alpha-N-acetylglucosaminidase N-terminal domain-containing protein [Bacteroidaceae bacterium]|nr:alpha-N-acetylglucosaminidase N-terminal domain-containing protein [Bacteroidaceae bacterium]
MSQAITLQAESLQAVADLMNRIDTSHTLATKVETRLDTTLGTHEQFIICPPETKGGCALIKGNTVSALTTGLNWYLNHYARINLSWNRLTTNMSRMTLPKVTATEHHYCNGEYRYYLNYCTFGYSMATWSWQRWEQEIDWMALHGINMPLQIVGLESVWRSFLMKDCGYSETQAEAFVPGPAYTAWWGMNNLQGWGGDGEDQSKGVTDNAWYERQSRLARQITNRERELGMEPVLPGYSGMVPTDFTERTGHAAEVTNRWCGFSRPYIQDPTDKAFAECAAKYYARLQKVMGTSKYYSMDPFHEGGTISSGAYAEGYSAI